MENIEKFNNLVWKLGTEDNLPNCNNVYRAREILLRYAPQIFSVIREGSPDESVKKLIKKIVEEMKLPYYWGNTIFMALKTGVFSVFKEDLTIDVDFNQEEVIVRLNKSTTKKEYEDAWKEIKHFQARLQEQTHIPVEISAKNFVFTFADLYKENQPLNEILDNYLSNNPELNDIKGYNEPNIRMNVKNIKDKLKIT